MGKRMIEHLSEHLPWLAKANYNAREWIYQLVMVSMTTPQIVDTKVVVTAIIIGVGSAYTASYVNAERNAVKLDATILRLEQANREQAEFRQEIRSALNGIPALESRVVRVEERQQFYHNGMAGMNGNGKSK